MEEQTTATEHREVDAMIPPGVIVLGDAATLTRGSTSNSVESKQTPYS